MQHRAARAEMKELEKEKQRIQKALEKLQKEKEAHEDGLKTAMADGNATREAFYMNQITAIRNQITEKEKQITQLRAETGTFVPLIASYRLLTRFLDQAQRVSKKCSRSCGAQPLSCSI